MNLEARRAVEALRAGVPNRDAVEFLGLNQPEIGSRFGDLMERLEESHGGAVQGFIVGGEFGAGKSHVLQALKLDALRNHFATSLVTISKETPLSSLDEVFKAAIRGLALPDRRPGDLNEVAMQLRPDSDRYRAFDSALRDGEVPVDPLFVATLLLSENIRPDEELADRIYTFWAGGRIKLAEVKRSLRFLPDPGIKIGRAPAAAALAMDRFRFAAGLMRAAGYKGWVLLLDEVELVASFSLKARAKAYVELAWLLGYDDQPVKGLGVVAAATQEFTGIVLREKQDQVKIPASAMAVKDPALVLRAGAALKTIAERPTTWERIVPQSAQDLDAAYRQVRDLYRRAFEWESESAARPPYADVARSMRMHVREWITRWDLERLDPSYSAHIETELMRPDLSEREGLEGFSERDENDDSDAAD